MPDHVTEGLVLVTQILEICGAGFLILGFTIDTMKWFQRIHREGYHPASERYRLRLGRSILIGLEILVAATIIKTITIEPTIEGLGLLTGLVVIRAMLGWTTALEIRGRWPWQRE